MNKYINQTGKFHGYSYIKVINNAGFIARFTVTYMLNGKLKKYKSSEFPLFQSDKIYIPSDAMLIALKVEEEAFIGKWVMFYIASFIRPINKCYSLSGTVIKPKATEVFCSGNYLDNCEIKKTKTKFTDYIYCD